MEQKTFLSGLIGNILEHYDTALFSLLAPFIAPLFFHTLDPFSALIMTYAMLPLGMIAKPLGSLCFGRIGDKYGRRQALCWSLSGMALATLAIGFLPTSKEIGPLAPLFLALARLLQSFFAAGEAAGGALYILEKTDVSHRSFISSIFDASTVGGILIASGLLALLSGYELVETYWRYLFWGGGMTALIGIFLRLRTEESSEFAYSQKTASLSDLLKYRRPFIAIILAAGFSYTTYSFAFIFMNGYVPMISSISKCDMLKVNTALLGLDFILLPFFGFLAHKFGKEKVMFMGALACCLGAVPLFSLLGSSSSFLIVTCVRVFIVVSGIAFAAPYHAWALEQVHPSARATVLCLGYAIGSQLIGTPTAAICLWIYQKTGWAGAPALYLVPVALGAILALRITERAKLRLHTR